MKELNAFVDDFKGRPDSLGINLCRFVDVTVLSQLVKMVRLRFRYFRLITEELPPAGVMFLEGK